MKELELQETIKEETKEIFTKGFAMIGGLIHYTYNKNTPDLEYPLSNPKDVWTFFYYNFIHVSKNAGFNLSSSIKKCKNEIDFFKLKNQKESDVNPKYKTELKNYDSLTFTAALVRNIERGMKQKRYTKADVFFKMAMQIYRAYW